MKKLALLLVLAFVPLSCKGTGPTTAPAPAPEGDATAKTIPVQEPVADPVARPVADPAASPVAAPPAEIASHESVADDELGLSRTSVFDTPIPAVVERSDVAPYRAKARPRAYPGAPPVVPHELEEGFDVISAEENLCLECHDGDIANRPSDDHFRDLRNAPGVDRQQVVGARYNCTTCHVPQTKAPPLVGSDFRKQ